MKKKFKLIICGAIILISLVLIAVKCAKAEELSIGDTLKKLPALKQGAAFSLQDNEFNYLSTIELAGYKGFTLEAGYSSNDKIVAVISYPILKLKDYLDLPILNLVEFNLGIYGGYGRIESLKEIGEADWGISATLISVKF